MLMFICSFLCLFVCSVQTCLEHSIFLQSSCSLTADSHQSLSSPSAVSQQSVGTLIIHHQTVGAQNTSSCFKVNCFGNSCSQRVIATFWTHCSNETFHLMKQVGSPMWKMANILRSNAIQKQLKVQRYCYNPYRNCKLRVRGFSYFGFSNPLVRPAVSELR